MKNAKSVCIQRGRRKTEEVNIWWIAQCVEIGSLIRVTLWWHWGVNVMCHWPTTMSQVCKSTKTHQPQCHKCAKVQKTMIFFSLTNKHFFLSLCTFVTLWLANVKWHWHPNVAKVITSKRVVKGPTKWKTMSKSLTRP